METLKIKTIIMKAKESLAGKDCRRLATLHAGVMVAAGLVVTLMQYVLVKGMGNTTGLSGLGTQAMLETIQTALQLANNLLMPFWNLGFLYVAMEWARGNHPQKRDLMMGFRRIGPYLGLTFNRFLLSFCVMFLCANLCSYGYLMTPAGRELQDMLLSMGSDVQSYYEYASMLSQAELTAQLEVMAPLLIVWGMLSLVILVPLLYRFRFAEYAILNHRGVRGLPAMLISASLLRRRCWQLFKLDLRLWWYYGLQLLCTLLLYGDMLLHLLGVSLPFGSEAAYLVSYVLYLAGLFCVQTLFRPRVETAYATAYETVMAMGPAPRKNSTVPQKMPWNEP